jgi:hypothetical protein
MQIYPILLFHPYWAQICPSAPCHQDPSVYVYHVILQTKFHAYIKLEGKSKLMQLK